VNGVDDWDRWDEGEDEDERETAHLAWVLATTLRVLTAPTPEEVHRALQALAAGGVEPSRHTVRQARARLLELAVRQDRSGGG
jgi:hypothetical protein